MKGLSNGERHLVEQWAGSFGVVMFEDGLKMVTFRFWGELGGEVDNYECGMYSVPLAELYFCRCRPLWFVGLQFFQSSHPQATEHFQHPSMSGRTLTPAETPLHLCFETALL